MEAWEEREDGSRGVRNQIVVTAYRLVRRMSAKGGSHGSYQDSHHIAGQQHSIADMYSTVKRPRAQPAIFLPSSPPGPQHNQDTFFPACAA